MKYKLISKFLPEKKNICWLFLCSIVFLVFSLSVFIAWDTYTLYTSSRPSLFLSLSRTLSLMHSPSLLPRLSYSLSPSLPLSISFLFCLCLTRILSFFRSLNHANIQSLYKSTYLTSHLLPLPAVDSTLPPEYHNLLKSWGKLKGFETKE